ncbi:MAG: hypothetical protein U0353_00165 [Sandaracinus sp.]
MPLPRTLCTSAPSTLHPRWLALVSALLACLAASSGCAHAALAPPRLVLAARYTSRSGGAHDTVASATLVMPLDARPPRDRGVPTPVELTSVDDAAALSAPYRDEPSVDELVALALESSLFDPSRARDARERARLSGLLPLVRADVRRGSGWDLRTQQGGTIDSAILASDDSWSVVGSVTLRLDRLLFAREEGSLLAEERRLEEARMHLVAELVRLYFERRRLQLERDRRGATDLATEARIAELGAMLDVLSAGGLSQRGR